MESLPDVKALAEVPDDELMKLWEGLGYYNRARNLKAAAVQIMEEFDGEIPSDYSKLLSLRGIGVYCRRDCFNCIWYSGVCRRWKCPQNFFKNSCRRWGDK